MKSFKNLLISKTVTVSHIILIYCYTMYNNITSGDMHSVQRNKTKKEKLSPIFNSNVRNKSLLYKLLKESYLCKFHGNTFSQCPV